MDFLAKIMINYIKSTIMQLYQPIKSTRKNKKYMVLVNGGRVIHFGDSKYKQFRDKLGQTKKRLCKVVVSSYTMVILW